jgi:hypothetical protein
MRTTTEWAVECLNADGDIVECEYFPTEREARGYRDRIVRGGATQVTIARVTNHWDRHDRNNLLTREYTYAV